MNLSARLSVRLSVRLSARLSARLSVRLSVRLRSFARRSVRSFTSVGQFVHSSVRLDPSGSVRPPVRPSDHPFVSPTIRSFVHRNLTMCGVAVKQFTLNNSLFIRRQFVRLSVPLHIHTSIAMSTSFLSFAFPILSVRLYVPYFIFPSDRYFVIVPLSVNTIPRMPHNMTAVVVTSPPSNTLHFDEEAHTIKSAHDVFYI